MDTFGVSVFHPVASKCVSFAVKLDVGLICVVPVLSASRHVSKRDKYMWK